MMWFLPLGDSALLINFEQRIDPEINGKVIQLYKSILSAQMPEVTFCSPAYCSITVGYDLAQTDFESLRQKIKGLEVEPARSKKAKPIEIPVCYEDAYAPDMEDMELQSGLTSNEIIALHTTSVYQVYMIGFLPGFAYMGTLPEALKCKRKETPRLRVPARSVGLAGLQTGIYPSEAPGGWQIIGRTPRAIFSPLANLPCRFQPGDQVTFSSISESEFVQMETDSNHPKNSVW
ncbi:MAG: 5-oxoprolinase subunit PxpB [Cyclobacteriaceae bacterium]